MKKTPLKRKTKLGQKKVVKEKQSLEDLKKKGLIKKASSLKRKPTGEAQVFKRIWDTRDHNCQICGVYLKEGKASNFSHLLPKGKFPEFRLDEDNIWIKCDDCHDRWHIWGNALRTSSKWAKFFTAYDDLWEKAHEK
jgi:5-methylcytosine-specific restriction endonuclease McrA